MFAFSLDYIKEWTRKYFGVTELKHIGMLAKCAFQKKTTECWEFIGILDRFSHEYSFIRILPSAKPERRSESYLAGKNFANSTSLSSKIVHIIMVDVLLYEA